MLGSRGLCWRHLISRRFPSPISSMKIHSKWLNKKKSLRMYERKAFLFIPHQQSWCNQSHANMQTAFPPLVLGMVLVHSHSQSYFLSIQKNQNAFPFIPRRSAPATLCSPRAVKHPPTRPRHNHQLKPVIMSWIMRETVGIRRPFIAIVEQHHLGNYK